MPIYKMCPIYDNGVYVETKAVEIDKVRYGGDIKLTKLNEIAFDLEIEFPLLDGRYKTVTLDLKDLRLSNNPNIKYINWNDTESKLEPYTDASFTHTFKNNSTTTPKKSYYVHVYTSNKSYVYEAFEQEIRRQEDTFYTFNIKVSNVLYRYTTY